MKTDRVRVFFKSINIGSQKCSKNLERSTGISPRRFGLPQIAINPEQVIRHYRFLSSGEVRGDRQSLLPEVKRNKECG